MAENAVEIAMHRCTLMTDHAKSSYSVVCHDCSFRAHAPLFRRARELQRLHQKDPLDTWLIPPKFRSVTEADKWSLRIRNHIADMQVGVTQHNPYDPGCSRRCIGEPIDPFAHCEACRA